MNKVNKTSINDCEINYSNWFKKYKFMIFNIKDFYSSISKKQLDDSINFKQQHVK